MISLIKIVDYLNNYLETEEIDDTCWNGLQFEGKKNVKKVAFAVDAAIETFKKAAALKSDLIVVHHGQFWKNQNPSLRDWSRKRIDILYKNNISLYACHLPLDRHKIVGNNSQIIKLLGGKAIKEFLIHSGKNIGWIGRLNKPKTVEEIVKILKSGLGSDPKVLSFGRNKINTIAVCSGGGGYRGFSESLEAGVDLYITGDTVEIFYAAKDSGMNVIFAGHHATEIIGLQALKKNLEKQFELETVFIDLPTGL